MITIPVTGLFALLSAAHLATLGVPLLFVAQGFIDYNPYLQVNFS